MQFMESSSITGRCAVILKSLLFSFMKLSSKGQHQRQNLVNLSKLLHVIQVLHYLYLDL